MFYPFFSRSNLMACVYSLLAHHYYHNTNNGTVLLEYMNNRSTALQHSVPPAESSFALQVYNASQNATAAVGTVKPYPTPTEILQFLLMCSPNLIFIGTMSVISSLFVEAILIFLLSYIEMFSIFPQIMWKNYTLLYKKRFEGLIMGIIHVAQELDNVIDSIYYVLSPLIKAYRIVVPHRMPFSNNPCVNCYFRQVNCIIEPCGHAKYCSDCVHGIMRNHIMYCYSCNTMVTSMTRITLAPNWNETFLWLRNVLIMGFVYLLAVMMGTAGCVAFLYAVSNEPNAIQASPYY